MAKKAKKSPPKRTEDPPAASGRLLSFFVTTLIVGIILYVAILIASRTAGFHYLVEERIEQHWQVPVQIERVWLKADGALVLEGIAARSDAWPAAAEMRLDEIQLRWQWRNLFRRGEPLLNTVEITGGGWTFQTDDQGIWRPTLFAGRATALARDLGLYTDADTTAPSPLDPATQIHFNSVNLVWRNADGSLLLALQEVDLRSTQTRMLGHELTLQEVVIGRGYWQDREQSRLERQLLWINNRPIPIPPP
jgi:hypothetical protein